MAQARASATSSLAALQPFAALSSECTCRRLPLTERLMVVSHISVVCEHCELRAAGSITRATASNDTEEVKISYIRAVNPSWPRSFGCRCQAGRRFFAQRRLA
eukprot:6185860-Pleurochrysis_carterae.AAC.5